EAAAAPGLGQGGDPPGRREDQDRRRAWHRGRRRRAGPRPAVEPEHDVGGGQTATRHAVSAQGGVVSSPEVGPDTPMAEILAAYPSAKVGLFQRYHIGGCASCGYQPHDTLQEVCSTHDIADPLDAVIACIREGEAVEATLHIRPTQVAVRLEGGDKLILLDVRAPEEWEAGHIEGAQLATVELTFEILDSWPKDTPLVLYSNHGNRSLDRASYFRAYGPPNPRSMDGGLKAWLALAGPLEEIRRHLAQAFPGARV